MVDESMWTVVFYTEENGASPVREFLQRLDTKTQVRFAWSIEQLRVRNVMAREPLVHHLEGKLWELREESNTNIYRLIYFFSRVSVSYFCMAFRRKPRKRLVVRLRSHCYGWTAL